MSGTREGGLRAAQTNKERWGDDFYSKTGALGGKKRGFETKSPKGFAANKSLASEAGRRGGEKSRRNSALAQQLIAMQPGESLTFRESKEVIRNRYHAAAKRKGIQISVIVSGEGCRLIRRA
jgi:general stress protein YciG